MSVASPGFFGWWGEDKQMENILQNFIFMYDNCSKIFISSKVQGFTNSYNGRMDDETQGIDGETKLTAL